MPSWPTPAFSLPIRGARRAPHRRRQGARPRERDEKRPGGSGRHPHTAELASAWNLPPSIVWADCETTPFRPLLLRGWKSHRPALRDRIVEILLGRRYWTQLFLDAVEKRTIAAGEVELVRWQESLENGDSADRRRASEFSPASLTGIGKRRSSVTNRPSNWPDAQTRQAVLHQDLRNCHKLGGR